MLTMDKMVHMYKTLTNDVFVDSAIWFGWFGYHVMRLPYFIRRYVVNPLIQTFVSSELLPGILSSHEKPTRIILLVTLLLVAITQNDLTISAPNRIHP